MKDTIWICRPDGTIQCEPTITGQSLEDARKELETLIGAKNVLNGKKRNRTVIAQCGTPTGSMNAFEVTQEGWKLLQTGTVGNPGYSPCDRSKSDAKEETRGSCSLENLRKELIGRPLRVYKTGDALTDDFIAERFNVEHDGNRKIVDVWFG